MPTPFNDMYIVVLKTDHSIKELSVNAKKEHVHTKAKGLLKKHDIDDTIQHVYETALHGFSVKLTPGQLQKLQEDDLIDYIEADQEIKITPIRS